MWKGLHQPWVQPGQRRDRGPRAVPVHCLPAGCLRPAGPPCGHHKPPCVPESTLLLLGCHFQWPGWGTCACLVASIWRGRWVTEMKGLMRGSEQSRDGSSACMCWGHLRGDIRLTGRQGLCPHGAAILEETEIRGGHRVKSTQVEHPRAGAAFRPGQGAQGGPGHVPAWSPHHPSPVRWNFLDGEFVLYLY